MHWTVPAFAVAAGSAWREELAAAVVPDRESTALADDRGRREATHRMAHLVMLIIFIKLADFKLREPG